MNKRIGLLLNDMILYERKNVNRIDHTMKVLSFAKAIAACENVDNATTEILEIACVLHDIGIRQCINKYNRSNGTFQEIEGPAIARKMMAKHRIPKNIMDCACFLIAHHHTYNRVDGIDYQILIEADMIVNMYEDNYSYQKIIETKNKYFKSKTGISYVDNLYLLNL